MLAKFSPSMVEMAQIPEEPGKLGALYCGMAEEGIEFFRRQPGNRLAVEF